jgi:hypothetical protein
VATLAEMAMPAMVVTDDHHVPRPRFVNDHPLVMVAMQARIDVDALGKGGRRRSDKGCGSGNECELPHLFLLWEGETENLSRRA